jgi:hypothetical protein
MAWEHEEIGRHIGERRRQCIFGVPINRASVRANSLHWSLPAGIYPSVVAVEIAGFLESAATCPGAAFFRRVRPALSSSHAAEFGPKKKDRNSRLEA